MATSFEDIAPIKHRKDKKLNARYDYSGKILMKSVSGVLLTSVTLVGLLSKIEYVVQGWIDATTGISNKNNYMEDPL